ncbi:MAG TPA: hypothetical protein VK586_02500 [Streptosporangiaceae bacterium]|nr:hypothetical protein [Streptosporangiaceae bacterium]
MSEIAGSAGACAAPLETQPERELTMKCATIGCPAKATHTVTYTMPGQRDETSTDDTCAGCAEGYSRRPALKAAVTTMAATQTQRECTAEEAAVWRARHSDGYQAGRGDARCGHGNRFELIEVPAELPGENGAQYAARHVGIAWEIGYTSAWRYEASR